MLVSFLYNPIHVLGAHRKVEICISKSPGAYKSAIHTFIKT